MVTKMENDDDLKKYLIQHGSDTEEICDTNLMTIFMFGCSSEELFKKLYGEKIKNGKSNTGKRKTNTVPKKNK